MSLVFLAVILGFNFWHAQHQQKDSAAPVQNSAEQKAPAPTAAVAPGSASSDQPASAATVQATGEQTTIVENELYKITFSNKGAQATSWILKKFKDENGQPLDMVNADNAKKFGYPLGLYTYDASLRDKLKGAMFVASATGHVAAPNEITFTYASGGIAATKTFKFDQSYVIHASSQVTVNGAAVTSLLTWPGSLGDEVTPALYAGGQIDYIHSGDVVHQAVKKVSSGETVNGSLGWGGMSDLYFAAIFLPDSPQTANFLGLHETTEIPVDPNNRNSKSATVSVLGAAMGDTTGSTSLRIYTGPKSLNVLRTIHATGADGKPTGESLEPLIDFGFWAFLAKPLFLWLHWTYDHVVHSWGWAILLLTLIINIAVLPLRVATMRSSVKMAKIQPQVASVREKYKKYKLGDPKQAEMNKELSALYKENGVNMFGGCLPTLIQFPLLFAFYSMLSKAIDLRQAKFLWIPDLSHPDPWHLLPIFLIISMFLTSYITPNPGMDPQQRKMMAFTMPATMGFFFWNIASGLSLYYAFANLISVVQQVIMNRGSMGQQMREIAQKRARKKAGQGKIIQGKR